MKKVNRLQKTKFYGIILIKIGFLYFLKNNLH